MRTPILASAAALALLAVPGLAQEAATGDQAAAGDPQMMMDAAIQSAEGVGMTSVADLPGAFVLQGVSPTGAPILMVVGPMGELLALATPMMVPEPGTVTQVEPTAAEGGDAPEAGEPADSGFMATQTQPASPNVWDPAMVEGAMQGLELGAGGAAGEVPQQ